VRNIAYFIHIVKIVISGYRSILHSFLSLFVGLFKHLLSKDMIVQMGNTLTFPRSGSSSWCQSKHCHCIWDNSIYKKWTQFKI